MMAHTDDHSQMIAAALASLPSWQGRIWQPAQAALIEEYCHLPDLATPWSADSPQSQAAKRYQYYEGDRHFHYWMHERWSEDGNLEMTHEVPERDTYQFFSRGAEYFIGQIVSELCAGHIADAARFAGSLLHALQDPTTPVHALESYRGLDWRALDTLLAPTNHRLGPTESATNTMLAVPEPAAPVDLAGYAPRLLGTTPAEAAFHLYQGHVESLLASRRLLIPMIESQRRGDSDEASAHLSAMRRHGAMISADTLFTVGCMAHLQQAPADQIEALDVFDLSTAYPIDAPAIVSGPYRFCPIAHDHAVDDSGQPVPLRLRLNDSGGSEATSFATGLATGGQKRYRIGYEVPKNVYRTFSCVMGIHSDLCDDNVAVRLSVKLDGQVECTGEFQGKNCLAKRVNIPIDCGGWLELFAQDVHDRILPGGTHIVWADMSLNK